MNEIAEWFVIGSCILAHLGNWIAMILLNRQSKLIDELFNKSCEQRWYINQLLKRTAGMCKDDIPITRMAEVSELAGTFRSKYTDEQLDSLAKLIKES